MTPAPPRRLFVLALLGALVIAGLTTVARSSRSAGGSTFVPLALHPDAITAACAPRPGTAPRLLPVLSGLRHPVLVTAPPGDPRLFVVEQPGRVRVVVQGVLERTPFLDVSERVESRGPEQGLLGLAFHPRFAQNGRFFVNYTAEGSGATVVAEHRVAPGSAVADPNERRLLVIGQRWENHNGGHLAFGPDSFLYIGMGDGGSGGDPLGSGQDKNSLLGAMLRIDVDRQDGELPYASPPDNPFVGVQGADEVVAKGLRNPWRFSFDRGTGDLWIGDVGQNQHEEIDRIPAGTLGTNLGWNRLEGDACFESQECDRGGMLAPVLDLSHQDGFCSVTGGYVYRGSCLPDLVGAYLYSDYCDNRVRTLRLRADGRASGRGQDLTGDARFRGISSFGEDAAGELYVVSHSDGVIWKLVPGE